MATVQIPPAAQRALSQLQALVKSSEGQIWAASLAFCIGSLELGFIQAAQTCLDKLAAEFAAYLDPRVKNAVSRIEGQLETLVTDLLTIQEEVGAQILDTAEAIDALLELGIQYAGPKTPDAIEGFVGQYLQLSQGGSPVALTPLTTPPVCTTGNSRHKGICCAALTQLGASVAATGFQYTSCSGRTVCMKCGIGASVSTKHPGRPIFVPRRVTCGPSGCPALGIQT